jgi:hypothetical protein
VSDGVEERVLALVAPDFADQKDGVEDDSGDEDSKENDADDEDGDVLFALDNPGYVEGDRETGEQDAKGDEEGDRSASSGDVHGPG